MKNPGPGPSTTGPQTPSRPVGSQSVACRWPAGGCRQSTKSTPGRRPVHTHSTTHGTSFPTAHPLPVAFTGLCGGQGQRPHGLRSTASEGSSRRVLGQHAGFKCSEPTTADHSRPPAGAKLPRTASRAQILTHCTTKTPPRAPPRPLPERGGFNSGLPPATSPASES